MSDSPEPEISISATGTAALMPVKHHLRVSDGEMRTETGQRRSVAANGSPQIDSRTESCARPLRRRALQALRILSMFVDDRGDQRADRSAESAVARAHEQAMPSSSSKLGIEVSIGL